MKTKKNNESHHKVDAVYLQAKRWGEELRLLRKIVLDCEVIEEYKWGQSCYTWEGKNIVIVSGFKEYYALNFFKGVLINDSHNLLVAAGENSQSARQIRFTTLEGIRGLEPILKKYILAAVDVERSGKKVVFKKQTEYPFSEELQQKMKKSSALRSAFESLTPGRQRAYLLYFSAPKQTATRKLRIEKSLDRIFQGKGMNDCVCGLSQRPPYCDGSHKYKD